ncbi:hypothetical protein AQI95_04670 [Streptomyces yokosukanensis]|uniref:Lipoprotein n=1 Tax=Streptomyces yokosukanensis TaxID=67386 RepID=A0A101PCT8_9ACTN|nr:hypothetical protein [Streptomyces yokosukanensis]KUN09150.1 hypothetical protein AQI95_04670 [Streptomyces yokosukanensis]
MRVWRPLLTATAVAALVAVTAGCAHHDGASSKAPTGAASATAPSAGPSQLAQMQKKLDAAESAAAAADRDAADTADR